MTDDNRENAAREAVIVEFRNAGVRAPADATIQPFLMAGIRAAIAFANAAVEAERDRLAAVGIHCGPLYRHKVRGTEYELIGRASLQDASGIGIKEGAELFVYRGDDGKLWAREVSEFHDGRFERVPGVA